MKVDGDMIADQWIFGRELSEECCSVFIYQCVEKNILLYEKLCSNLIVSFYVCCLNFLEMRVVLALFLSISWLCHIISIVLIYFWCRDKNVAFQIVPWKYFRMLGHRLYPLHILLLVNNLRSEKQSYIYPFMHNVVKWPNIL